MSFVIVSYNEIALKKGNRDFFESILFRNIKDKLGSSLNELKKDYGFFVLDVKDDVSSQLSKIPGIANFSFVLKSSLDIEDIKKKSLELVKNKEFESFKVSCSRQNKDFKLSSREINIAVGDVVGEKYPDKKVKMKGNDLTVFIKVCNKNAFIFSEKIKGVGGMPVGSAGKVVCLLSGGIDSPVAGYMMNKRGAKNVYVHFQNNTNVKNAVKDKVEKLVKQLSKFQGETKLYIVPFEKLQKQIIQNIDSKLRMLTYRRFMLRIAEKIRRKEKAKALVTGDSLSQVASQTLDNLNAVYDAVDSIILNPLIGLNKDETMDIARNIETYEISILPYGDCCSFFIAEHPETMAKIDDLRKAEESLDVDKLVEEALKEIEVVKVRV